MERSVSSVNAATTIFFTPCLARSSREFSGVNAVAGDDPENLRCVHLIPVAEKVHDREGAIVGTRGACAPQTLAVVTTAFHVQLGKRLLHGGLDRSHFFRCVIFFHRRLRTRNRFFGCLNVDLLGFQRHVG